MNESRGGRPGLLVPNSPYGLCGCKATVNKHKTSTGQELCESRVAVLGSLSLIVRTVSVDAKQQ